MPRDLNTSSRSRSRSPVVAASKGCKGKDYSQSRKPGEFTHLPAVGWGKGSKRPKDIGRARSEILFNIIQNVRDRAHDIAAELGMRIGFTEMSEVQTLGQIFTDTMQNVAQARWLARREPRQPLDAVGKTLPRRRGLEKGSPLEVGRGARLSDDVGKPLSLQVVLICLFAAKPIWFFPTSPRAPLRWGKGGLALM